jgi:TonB family protein
VYAARRETHEHTSLPAHGLPAALLRRTLVAGAATCLMLGVFTGLALLIAPRLAAPSQTAVRMGSRLPLAIPVTELRFPISRPTGCICCCPPPACSPRPTHEIEIDGIERAAPDFRDDLHWTEGPVASPVRQGLGKNFLCVPVRRSEPDYPASARRRKLEGQVLVDIAIDPTGRVHNASVLEAEPAGVFDASALRAVRRWRYPASSAGATCQRTQVRMRFAL